MAVPLRLISSRATTVKEDPLGQNISARSSDAPRQIAYGFCRLGGTLTFLRADQGDTGQFLHVAVTYAGHEIDRVTDLYLDGVKVDFPSNVDGAGRRILGWATAGSKWQYLVFANVTSTRGEIGQAANPDMRSQSDALFPGVWTDNHRQQGCAHAYLILKYDPVVFQNGMPEIALEGQWKNNIYDPRNTTTGYSNNAALCLVNYMTDSRYGPAIPWADFDSGNVADAADACDEAVSLAAGGTEARYTCNGVFEVSRGYTHDKVISDMCLAMAGRVTFGNGKWRLWAGVWRDPVVTLDENDLRSGMNIVAKPSSSDVSNGVKGKFRAAVTEWQESDYPSVTNSLYRTQDGQELWLEQDLLFTTSSTMAQRIAKILLEENRQWITVSARFGLNAYIALPGENVRLTAAHLGWNAKEFLVEEFTFVPSESGLIEIELQLRETVGGVFDWNNGEETTFDIAPNTDLTFGFFALSGLALASGTNHLYQRSDGTVFSRLFVSWTPSQDPFLLISGRVEVQYKQTASSVWESAASVPGDVSSLYILDVQDGKLYDVRIRPMLLTPGDWQTVTGHLVLGKLEIPTAPTNLIATLKGKGIEFSWSPIADLDLELYEIRVGASWEAGTRIAAVKATSYLWDTQASGSYIFWLAAKDTSNNYSNRITTSITINAPGKVTNLESLVIYNLVQFKWAAPSTTSFPVDYYKLYRWVNTEAERVEVGSTRGTILLYNEPTGGTISYEVAAVDVHGNEGDKTVATVNVESPVNFVLVSDQILDPNEAATLTNCVVEDNQIIAPVLTSETWQGHFDGNTWTTPQEQIDAGFPIYIQPTNTSAAEYAQVYDYGAVIPSCLIAVSFVTNWVAGSGTVAPEISYSEDNTNWMATPSTQVFGTSFRYVRVRLTITGDDTTSVVRISEIRLRLDVKTEEDTGVIVCDSTDAAGSLITFNRTFLDVDATSIQLTYNGNQPYFTAYTFNDFSMKLRAYLWDPTSNGTRRSGSATWRVKGVVASTESVWTPATLFEGGRAGVFYDPTDLLTMYQDSAGTTPVYQPGQGSADPYVGKILDKSGNNHHATAENGLPSRPTLTARYNLLTGTTALVTQSITTIAGTYKLRFVGTGSITLSGTATGVKTQGAYVITTTAGTLTLTVSGSVTLADCREYLEGADLPKYQAVINASTYDTTGFPFRLQFNGTTNYMRTNLDLSASDQIFLSFGVKTSIPYDPGILMEYTLDTNVNNGAFFIQACRLGIPGYHFRSKGTIAASIDTPDLANGTTVLTAITDISAPLSQVRTNGVLVGTNTATQGTGNYKTTSPFYIGGGWRSSVLDAFQGFLGPIVLRGGAASDIDILRTEGWINETCGGLY